MMNPLRNKDILMKQVGRESMLYRTNDKAVHVLNPTAKLIWEQADGKHSLEDIETAIRSRFAVPEGHDVVTDIKNTLKAMVDKELLNWSE